MDCPCSGISLHTENTHLITSQDLERGDDLVGGVCVCRFSGHEVNEGLEGDGATSIGIHDAHDASELSITLAEGKTKTKQVNPEKTGAVGYKDRHGQMLTHLKERHRREWGGDTVPDISHRYGVWLKQRHYRLTVDKEDWQNNNNNNKDMTNEDVQQQEDEGDRVSAGPSSSVTVRYLRLDLTSLSPEVCFSHKSFRRDGATPGPAETRWKSDDDDDSSSSTRLVPVEMSRARKSSETICPDRFCGPSHSQTGDKWMGEESEEWQKRRRRRKERKCNRQREKI